jgi:hypothetical protein
MDASNEESATEHPLWCSPRLCNAKTNGKGWHNSEPIVIKAHRGGPSEFWLSLSQMESLGDPMLSIEVQHDLDICRALEISDEPDLALLSLDQADQLRRALDRLLNLTSKQPVLEDLTIA